MKNVKVEVVPLRKKVELGVAARHQEMVAEGKEKLKEHLIAILLLAKIKTKYITSNLIPTFLVG